MQFTDNDLINWALSVIEIEAHAIANLSRSIGEDFTKACRIILSCTGKIIVTGLGKSGHIANKIAASLASTGTPAFFIHPTEANHGDLGMISKNDVIIAISNSGNNHEIENILKITKELNIESISITNNPKSKIAKLTTQHLNLNVSKEACNLGLAPTTTTTATLVIGDALTITLAQAKKFTENDFAKTHPGGNLGKRLLKITDIMLTNTKIPKVTETTPLNKAILEMTEKKLGMTTIVAKNNPNKMLGIFTDGDLRRVIEKNIDLYNTPIEQVMTNHYKSILPEELAYKAISIMETHKISMLAVIDKHNNLVGALNMHQLLNAGII